ncbi:lysozyme inhibitor LprI family protein [Maritimibacter alkaliphilus]|uniref:lysozyme inhibitor LprI family protein n=1 Tax=Maritimibacter alkaliphilus TaxID=404236 RepID=UPI001C96228C|nr:lysozyme inhibitor LprI family protein [Maritimibacter alkaliphilus]MBY6088863.1 DUF1311 domain-containing protein [Maritimibacter alkaliphilus]
MTVFRVLLPGAMALVLSALASAGQAQDCSAPVTQIDMTTCAGRAFETADAALNAAYTQAMALAKERGPVPAGQDTDADLLRAAQRAWIPFRDAACEAESTLARGGSLQPMLKLNCLERLTRQRTEDLKIFSGLN